MHANPAGPQPSPACQVIDRFTSPAEIPNRPASWPIPVPAHERSNHLTLADPGQLRFDCPLRLVLAVTPSTAPAGVVFLTAAASADHLVRALPRQKLSSWASSGGVGVSAAHPATSLR